MPSVYDCSVDTDLLTGFRLAKVSLDRQELVVLPTDTVYGIAANAFSPKAVENLLNAKGRDRTSPPPVLIPKVETLSALAADLPLVANQLASAFWPGALTMVLKRSEVLTGTLVKLEALLHFAYQITKLRLRFWKMSDRWQFLVQI